MENDCALIRLAVSYLYASLLKKSTSSCVPIVTFRLSKYSLNLLDQSVQYTLIVPPDDISISLA